MTSYLFGQEWDRNFSELSLFDRLGKNIFILHIKEVGCEKKEERIITYTDRKKVNDFYVSHAKKNISYFPLLSGLDNEPLRKEWLSLYQPLILLVNEGNRASVSWSLR